MRVLALFGPTAVGKTDVAIAVADLLRERDEDPVAISCDAIQVYRGLEVLSGAATREQRQRLEHRLVSFVDIREEFSAGQFAEMARAEIDDLTRQGRRPILVGGTGLYLRAAISDMELMEPVPEGVRREVEEEIDRRGSQALHAELPRDVAKAVHPHDRKRVARATELRRAGMRAPAGPGGLWTASVRVPTLVVGLVMNRDELAERIDARVDRMLESGARTEVRKAIEVKASRTARAALGFQEFLNGDIEAVKSAHRSYGRRQLTWMRKMDDVMLVDRSGRDDAEVGAEIVAALDRAETESVIRPRRGEHQRRPRRGLLRRMLP